MTRDRRLLLVGEDFGNSPSRYHHDAYALTGQSGRRLAAMARLDPLDFYLLTYRTNVVVEPDDWQIPYVVAEGVARVTSLMNEHERVIFLGSRVAAAFLVDSFTSLTWHRSVVAGAVRTFARMPHPSGRNRVWNDPLNIHRASDFLAQALEEIT